MPGPTFTNADIKRYYDRNTAAFVRLGQGGGALHRTVWGPGVGSREQAFDYVHEMLAQRFRQLGSPAPVVADLGCGVGATLCALAARLPLCGTGITISGVQAEMARRRFAQLGLSDRLSCIEGDFSALPPSIGTVDAAFAIESFVHAPSPERFFHETARIVRAGGLLIICDDVRRDSGDERARIVCERFARGWHVNALLSVAEINRLAAAAGFVQEESIDLTPYLELGRPRDRLIDIVAGALGWLPLTQLAPLVGGAALQEGLRRGWLAYELMVFRRE